MGAAAPADVDPAIAGGAGAEPSHLQSSHQGIQAIYYTTDTPGAGPRKDTLRALASPFHAILQAPEPTAPRMSLSRHDPGIPNTVWADSPNGQWRASPRHHAMHCRQLQWPVRRGRAAGTASRHGRTVDCPRRRRRRAAC